MKKGIKFLISFILIFAILSSIPAFANYNTVFEKSLKNNHSQIYSNTYLLVNLDNGTVIFEKNADKKSAPASLTKIITASVVIENCPDLNKKITIESTPIRLLDGTGSSLAGLIPGEKISIKDLLYCLLVRSGNDAANVLAQYVGGTIPQFVDMMNELAKKLGCKNTHFANPHGLDEAGHYTTARDLLKFTKHALTLPHFEEICSTHQYKIPATNKSPERYLNNTNKLMNKAFADYYSPYASGIKTGTTDNAGRCVISKGSGNGYNYLAVIMGAPFKNIDDDPIEENCAFVDCKAMFNWVFKNIELKSVASPNQIVTEVPISLSFEKDFVSLVPSEEVLALVPKGTDGGGVLIEPIPSTIGKEVKAPVEKGQVLGQARVLYAGSEIARVNLVASETISRNPILFITSIIKDAFTSTPFKIIASVFSILLILFLTIQFVHARVEKKKKELHLVTPTTNSSGKYTDKPKRKAKRNK